MYYREEVINGKTYFKTSPDGEWNELSNNILTSRLTRANDEIRYLLREVDNLQTSVERLRGYNP